MPYPSPHSRLRLSGRAASSAKDPYAQSLFSLHKKAHESPSPPMSVKAVGWRSGARKAPSCAKETPSGISARVAPRWHPWPCGYYGDLKRECRCGPPVIQRYRQRISGPLLDRIDLHVDVPAVDYKTLSSKEQTESSATIRERVEKARAIQRDRFKDEKGMHSNAAMTPRLIRKHCELDTEASGYLEHAMSGQNFSARAHDRILKVARTLADLEASERVQGNHVLEAINYRTLDRALWS